jgi:hypothetical protein
MRVARRASDRHVDGDVPVGLTGRSGRDVGGTTPTDGEDR